MTGKSLTPLEALNEIGCLRLGARIYDLKRQGYDIKSEIVHKNGKHYSSYYMATKLNGNQYEIC